MFENLPPGTLPPGGIEVQILDYGYTEQHEKQTGKKADWFRTDGEVRLWVNGREVSGGSECSPATGFTRGAP